MNPLGGSKHCPATGAMVRCRINSVANQQIGPFAISVPRGAASRAMPDRDTGERSAPSVRLSSTFKDAGVLLTHIATLGREEQ